MREIVTAVEMKELDHNTIQKAGISSPVLMERAALKTVEEIVQRLKNKERAFVVCFFRNSSEGPFFMKGCPKKQKSCSSCLKYFSTADMQAENHLREWKNRKEPG